MWSKSTTLSKSFKSHGNKVIQNLNSDFESHETGCTCTIFWRNAFVDELSNPLWTKKNISWGRLQVQNAGPSWKEKMWTKHEYWKRNLIQRGSWSHLLLFDPSSCTWVSAWQILHLENPCEATHLRLRPSKTKWWAQQSSCGPHSSPCGWGMSQVLERSLKQGWGEKVLPTKLKMNNHKSWWCYNCSVQGVLDP